MLLPGAEVERALTSFLGRDDPQYNKRALPKCFCCRVAVGNDPSTTTGFGNDNFGVARKLRKGINEMTGGAP